MHPDELLEAIRREGAAMASALGDDLSAEVPSCPGWSLETLTNHAGRVVLWATEAVRTGATERPPFPPRPERIDREWFSSTVDGLVAALEEAGPDAACWNHLGQPQASRFWFRRQAHELAVHRWDAENARNPSSAGRIYTELALDGIDELVDIMFPLGYQGQDLGGTVHLHATDSPHGEWLFATAGGELLVGHDHQKGDVAVRGPASDLLLWLWGRLSPETAGDIEVFGDRAVLDRFREVLKAP